MTSRQVSFLLAALVLSGCATYGINTLAPPVADKRPVELVTHGDVRVDYYFWLNQRDDPDVIAYLDAENAYTDAMLEKTAGFRERLVAEMAARINPDESTAPYRHGEFYYYTRYEEGQEYPIYARRNGSMQAAEEILLDVNAAAEDEAYFSARSFKASPDHRHAAYAADNKGRRLYELRFIDLATGETLADRIEGVTGNYEWANDGKTVIYVKQDPETLRWNRIYRHEVGSDVHELVYEEADETFSVYVYKPVSGKFIYIASQSTLSTEIRYLPSDAPATAPTVFLPREAEHEYFVTDGRDRFYVMSNVDAPNFRVLEASLEDTSMSGWTVVIPHREKVLIENIDVFKEHLVITGKRLGMAQIEVFFRNAGVIYPIDFDEPVFSATPGDNYEYDTDILRYDYESMTTPESVYDFDMNERKRELVKEQEVLGGFDRADYQSERQFFTARDGTPIPVSLVYRKGIKLDGSNPLLQYAYGSYGSSTDPAFSSTLLSLLDRGFIYAVAHVRGGSEMGRQWYYDGRQLKKMNTFTDFIDVSKLLIQNGYTSRDHLYARGGSAGGLLMGAVMNMAPELYNGISTRVPFVDVVTTMLDASIPLTASEWDEWGDPRKKEFYDYMLSYSPYDQVQRQAYPNTLVTTSLHDSQVQYWEPAKWVAKLRDYKTDNHLLLLATDMQAGHSGKTGRFKRLEDAALYYTFFLNLEGLAR